MLRSRIIASAALAILLSGCASRRPPPITAAQANALPVEQLAQIVLRQLAGRVRSVTRPNYDSLLFPGMPLQRLVFTTTPISSSFQGLCEASVMAVSFAERLPFPPPGRNAPVRAQGITTAILYKVVGEIDLAGLTLEAWERQNLQCAALESVIPPEENRLGFRQFFHFHGDLSAGHGAAILQGLLRGVGNGTHTDYQCAPHGRCEDAGAMLRALSLNDLLTIGIERAPQSPTLFTVSASFVESGTEGTITLVEVTVEAELDAPGPPRLVRRLGRATVRGNTLIRD